MQQLARQYVALGLAACVGFVDSSSAQAVRTIAYSANRAIVDRISQHDQVVVVQRSLDSTVYSHQPAIRDYVVDLANDSQAHGVHLVDLARVNGRLVDEGRWVYSEFTTIVAETLQVGRVSAAKPTRGSTLQFSLDGGEVRIGGVLVRTDNAVSFPQGRRYLVFLGPVDEWTGKPELRAAPMLIEGSRLRSLTTAPSLLNAVRLSEVRSSLGSKR